MKTIALIVSLACTTCANAQSVSEDEARAYASRWLQRNPPAASHRRTEDTPLQIGDVELLALDESGLPFYLIRLHPQGHIVMNSDRRLNPVLCFSLSGQVCLEACEGHAFYQLLLLQSRANAERIASAGAETAASSQWNVQGRLQIASEADEVEVIGPLLRTAWGQGNHYNEYCPPALHAPDGCDGRTPTGCVATAFAQIMKYHEWPYRGTGWTVHEDATGDITGTHTAVFSDPYEWWHMQNDYYAFGNEPNDAVRAVSELMYELGVAAGVDYEDASSSSSPVVLGSKLRRHFLYEPPVRSESTDTTSFVEALLSELNEGRPCVADIPGHSLLVDGVMRQQEDYYFHLNYGWSGQNDGWYLLDQLQEQVVTEIHTEIRPMLTAIPLDSEPAADGLELRWVLPETRRKEATRMDVLARRTVSGTFTDHGEDFSAFEVTATRDADDWSLSAGGYVGTCFHKPPGGHPRVEYHLTSSGQFRPGPTSQLSFKARYGLLNDSLAVRISTDGGSTYSTVWSARDRIKNNWTGVSVPLGTFAEEDIVIEFAYLPGAYYLEGGAWIDDIQVTSAQWYEWDVIHQVHELEAYRAESTTVFHDAAEDFSAFRPAAGNRDRDWSVSEDADIGACFYKPPAGQGGSHYSLTSTRAFPAEVQTRLVFDARYMLLDDAFSVLISTDNGHTWSTVRSVTDAVRQSWTEVDIPLSAFAGRDVLIRFDYAIEADDYYYQEGGVWIDNIRLIDMTGSEYRNYPVYHTLLPDLVAGVRVLAYQVWSGQQAHRRSEAFSVEVAAVD